MNYSHVLIGCLIFILTVYLQQTSIAASSVNNGANYPTNEATGNKENGGQASKVDIGQVQKSAVALFRAEHNNSLFQIILSDLFGDINWNTIREAREQVEKFIRRLEKVWSFFRSSMSSQSSAQNPISSLFAGSEPSGAAAAAGQSKRDNPRQPFIAKLFGLPSTASASPSAFPADDQTNVKAMLERVACFVGYMRLLTHSQAALADLDASKAVSNLFTPMKSNSNNSLFGSWFG